MSFRVPVLETYLWQPQVRAIINNPTEVTFAKGDRFIVGSTPAAGSVFEGHANAIAWYDGTEWKFEATGQGVNKNLLSIAKRLNVPSAANW